MPLLETKGAGSAQGFGLSLGGEEAVYIEDVFSTYLYTGTGASLSIVNEIDLSTEGGLVWAKRRDSATGHCLQDTARGAGNFLASESTSGNNVSPSSLTSFNSNGFTLGTDGSARMNASGASMVSWTFRKQPKFFDVVTYTGNGTAGRTVAHNLGSVPGCMIIKRTDQVTNWEVFHRSLGATKFIWLNSTSGEQTSAARWNDTAPTSTQFTVGNSDNVNASGGTYVAYLFAHNAGGFGLTGLDNVISCGTFTAGASGFAAVTLGYEPQWILFKKTDGAQNWYIWDTMRGMALTSSVSLSPNLSGAELNWGASSYVFPTATGFQGTGDFFGNGSTVIYIAIRRGPMKVPTSGTSVYNGITRTGTGANATVTGAGFPVDLLFSGSRSAAFGTIDFDRLRGATQRLFTYTTAAEAARATSLTSFAVQDGYTVGDDATDGGVNNSGQTYIYWNFRRAPGFFDVVCYTGTGSATNYSHNLGVAPQLIILKNRSSAVSWFVMYSGTSYMILNNTNGGASSVALDLSLATASTFYLGADGGSGYNGSGSTYVAYLFATCAGVSKVGSYTGNGSSQTINCGFTGGARFVLIKKTSGTGDWVVFDSARGIVSGNDPFLELNTTAAEQTGQDAVDTDSTGFIVNETTESLNASGGTYIFLAIA
jgi:hypothetical protein